MLTISEYRSSQASRKGTLYLGWLIEQNKNFVQFRGELSSVLAILEAISLFGAPGSGAALAVLDPDIASALLDVLQIKSYTSLRML